VRRTQVIVIGAGVGGLTAAAELAAGGCAVTVLERTAQPGGKVRQVEIDECRLDVGPTVLTMRWVFDELFAALGSDLNDHLRLHPASILARHAWDDRGSLDLYADRARTIDAIGRFAGAGEAHRYAQFCAHAAEIFTTLDAPFMRVGNPDMLGLISHRHFSGVQRLTRIAAFSTLWQALGAHFNDQRLRQLFARYATYCGSSPFSAPGTLMLIAHAELAGVWCAEGGIYGLARALVALGRQHGVEHRYCCDVREILLNRRQVTGVMLADGTQLGADIVICNADIAAVSAGLFGQAARRAVPAVDVRQRSLSALTLALHARTSGFPLAHHSVFFGDDYAGEFADVFSRRTLPAKPSVYVCAQDRGEHASPPAAGEPERLFCIINAPANGDTRQFSRHDIDACREAAIAQLARCGLTLDYAREQLVTTTPRDFDKLFPGTGGGLYGSATHGWRSSFSRPGVRSRIPGLYLTGGSVHPGAGLPMVTLSGRLAAASALEDLRSGRGRSRVTVPHAGA